MRTNRSAFARDLRRADANVILRLGIRKTKRPNYSTFFGQSVKSTIRFKCGENGKNWIQIIISHPNKFQKLCRQRAPHRAAACVPQQKKKPLVRKKLNKFSVSSSTTATTTIIIIITHTWYSRHTADVLCVNCATDKGIHRQRILNCFRNRKRERSAKKKTTKI